MFQSDVKPKQTKKKVLRDSVCVPRPPAAISFSPTIPMAKSPRLVGIGSRTIHSSRNSTIDMINALQPYSVYQLITLHDTDKEKKDSF